MLIKERLKEIELPKIYMREGKKCYFDTYRKKLIEITPEETVRQKIARLFETEYKVPKEMISLEVPMSYYVQGASGRADIVIHREDKEDNCLYPVAIIECKKENVFLTDNVFDQAINYCDIVGGDYIIVTNGIEIEMAAYDGKTDSYIVLNEILQYREMLNQEYLLPEVLKENFERFSITELENQEKIEEYSEMGTWIFGQDTPPWIRTFAVNFCQAMLDDKHTLPLKKYKNCEVIKDIGRRYMDYGNAGGGHYNGIYRSFLVRDRFGETQIVSISIFGTTSDLNDEKRGSYTSLVLAIDRFKTSHNSLQYNVDRFAKQNGNTIVFTHNGQISSFKSSYVIEKVKQVSDRLSVFENSILLGKVDTDELLYLDDTMFADFIYNMIEYALLREEVRQDIRKARGTVK